MTDWSRLASPAAWVVKPIAGFFPAGLPVSLFGTTVSVGFAISIGLLAGCTRRSAPRGCSR